MALTSTEQNKAVQILGYGGKTLDSTSVIFNKVLYDRLQNLNIDTENLVRSYLTQVSALETQLFAAPGRAQAEQVGDIRTNLREMEMLRSERRKLAREIAAHLDIPYIGKGGTNVAVEV